ncbi:MAG: Flp pilus assembly protein CpaB [Paracoccaceae bacterium]
MRAGSIMTALVGVIIAGASVFYASTLSPNAAVNSAAVAAEVAPSNVIDVYVANADIPFGAEITIDKLTVQTWPVDAVPLEAITDINELINESAEPRRAKRQISQGEMLLPSKLSAFGETVTIVQKLGPNMRAVAIQVDAVTGVGGFVSPGDQVDIVLTQGRDQDLTSTTILQAVNVIGVDQAADFDEIREGIARTVTVEVSARDGQKLALAQNAGQLSLTLRTLDNATNETLAPVTLADVLGTPKPVEPVVAAPAPVVVQAAPQTIRVRRGNEESVITLDQQVPPTGPTP